MNPGRYFIPNLGMGPMMNFRPNFGMNQAMSINGFTVRNSLFSRISDGIKNFNWSGLLNGANRTLNVVNQTIPLIRQTKPMINNVKNMINLTKAFRKETTSANVSENLMAKKEVMDNGNPNFFI